MTLTEALAPYTVTGSIDDLPVTSDRVAVEFDLLGGKRYLSQITLEVGDDLFIKIVKPWGDRPLSMEFESGAGVPTSVDMTAVSAVDLAACLDWAARQETAPVPN